MSMQQPRVFSLVIVGSGVEAAVTAAVLANALENTAVKITVIQTAQESEVDRCAALSPSIQVFNKILGIHEADLVAATAATFTLAQRYTGHHKSAYFFPYGEHGFTLKGMNFFSYAAHLQSLGDNTPYDQYSLSAVAASLGRFRHPAAEAKSLYSTLAYGLNFSASLFSRYLTQYAQKKSVEFIDATIEQYVFSANTGNIDKLMLQVNAAGENYTPGQQVTLECDLIVDCSGKRAAVMGDALAVTWLESTRSLPVDRRIDVMQAGTRGAPVNQLQFLSSGLSRSVSLKNNNAISYIYNSAFITEDQALSELSAQYEIARHSLENNSAAIQLKPGRRASFWYKNCVAIGASAGDLTSTYIDQLHLTQSAALRLATLFPASPSFAHLSAEYNRLTHLECDHVEDFHSLHFQVPGMPLTDFWSAQKKAVISDRLQHRISLFTSAGRVPFFEGETLAESAWLSFMVGLFGWPKDYSCLIEQNDSVWIKEQLQKMQNMMYQAAQAMPDHDTYLAQYLAGNAPSSR